jgi:hypothetical protein
VPISDYTIATFPVSLSRLSVLMDNISKVVVLLAFIAVMTARAID